MAQNFAGVYGGNVEVPAVDLNPLMNYMMKRQAQQEAKEATLTKYFSTLTDRATGEGVRDQDQLAFHTSLQDSKNFWIKNKDAIISGKNPEVTAEYQRKVSIPFKIMARSKAVFNDAKSLKGILANPDLRERVTDETMGIDSQTGQPKLDPITGRRMGINAMDQPIYLVNPDGSLAENPDFKSFDLADIQTNPKEYDAKEIGQLQDETAKDLEFDKKTGIATIDPNDKLYDIIPTEKYFSKDKLKVIGDRALLQMKDPRLKYTFEKQHPLKGIKGEAMYDKANELFKSIYGKDIENNNEFWAGMVMANKNQKITSPERVLNKQREQASDFAYFKKQEEFKNKLPPAQRLQYDKISTAFDEIPDGPIPGTNLHIENGVVLDAKNKPYTSPKGTFDITIGLDNTPTTISDIYKKETGYDRILVGKLEGAVSNGRIQALKSKVAGIIGRDKLVRDVLGSQNQKNPKLLNDINITTPAKPRGKKGSLN